MITKQSLGDVGASRRERGEKVSDGRVGKGGWTYQTQLYPSTLPPYLLSGRCIDSNYFVSEVYPIIKSSPRVIAGGRIDTVGLSEAVGWSVLPDRKY